MTNYGIMLSDAEAYDKCKCSGHTHGLGATDYTDFKQLRSVFRRAMGKIQKEYDISDADLLVLAGKFADELREIGVALDEAESENFCLTALTKRGRSSLKYKTKVRR